MKFYESLFTIFLALFITISALKFGPIINISLLITVIGSAFYMSMRLFLDEKTLFDPTFAGASTFLIYFSNTFANYLRDANEKNNQRSILAILISSISRTTRR